jgi:RND family efflux transporter MFP subunit
MLPRLRLLIFLAVALPALAHAQNGGAPAAPVVSARPFADVALFPEREAPATAQSLNEARLAAEVSAAIAAIPVEVGQTVAAGAVLVRLEARDFELGLARAKAQLDAAQSRLQLAESQLARARDLRARNFISSEALHQRESEAEVQRAEVALNRAQLDTARRALAKATIRAPYRAIVRQRLANVGELASPGTPLVSLVDLSRIEVAAQVQVKDAESLAAARDIRLQALGRQWPLELTRISPAINRDARNVEARLAFGREAAPPGADGRILWRDHRPHVPAELLVRREGGLGVFVVNDAKAHFVPIAQAQEGRPAAANLPPATRIVTEGRQVVRDGQPVTLK